MKKSRTAPVTETKRELVASRLRQAILGGDLRPGQRMYETEIAARFGVSSTPVREAFRTLHAEGLVTLLSRRGAVVTYLTADDIREIFEMREALEAIAAKNAVQKISPKELSMLQRLVEKLDSAKAEPLKYFPLNIQFHTIIYKASRKKRLLTTIESLRNITRYYSWAAIANPALLDVWHYQHHEMLNALLSRDSDKMESLVVQHVRHTSQALEDYFLRLGYF